MAVILIALGLIITGIDNGMFWILRIRHFMSLGQWGSMN